MSVQGHRDFLLILQRIRASCNVHLVLMEIRRLGSAKQVALIPRLGINFRFLELVFSSVLHLILPL